jgi:hypothetical protein
MENENSIYLNIVTKRQSMYKACSVTKVPTAKVLLNEQASNFVVEGTDTDRGNVKQMVQQSVNHAI